MGRIKDLTGKKLGRITVLNRLGTNKNKKPTWNCRCECGNLVVKERLKYVFY